jgi:hypothetical protein
MFRSSSYVIMPATGGGKVMRLVCAMVAAACLSLLPLSLGGGSLKAMVVCGTFDGKFSCKSSLGGVPRGKNALPGVDVDTTPGSEGSPEGQAMPNAMPDAGNMNQGAPYAQTPDGTVCQHGMTGTPPNCRCPKNSELLGGNCVHYTASACSNGLTADAMPEPCQGMEEKLSCSIRNDGLKDCCCVTYDKF